MHRCVQKLNASQTAGHCTSLLNTFSNRSLCRAVILVTHRPPLVPITCIFFTFLLIMNIKYLIVLWLDCSYFFFLTSVRLGSCGNHRRPKQGHFGILCWCAVHFSSRYNVWNHFQKAKLPSFVLWDELQMKLAFGKLFSTVVFPVILRFSFSFLSNVHGVHFMRSLQTVVTK